MIYDWYDIYDTIWYDMIRYNAIWYTIDMIYTIRYGMIWYDIWWYDMIYLLTAIGLTHSDSSTEHIYTQTMPRTTQITTKQFFDINLHSIPTTSSLYSQVCAKINRHSRSQEQQAITS
jgi:hypothetical protein